MEIIIHNFSVMIPSSVETQADPVFDYNYQVPLAMFIPTGFMKAKQFFNWQ
jgi:hypothetical protein